MRTLICEKMTDCWQSTIEQKDICDRIQEQKHNKYLWKNTILNKCYPMRFCMCLIKIDSTSICHTLWKGWTDYHQIWWGVLWSLLQIANGAILYWVWEGLAMHAKGECTFFFQRTWSCGVSNEKARFYFWYWMKYIRVSVQNVCPKSSGKNHNGASIRNLGLKIHPILLPS